MLTALIMNSLLIPVKLLINLIRTLIYNARGAIDTTGVYRRRWESDNRVMILNVEHDGKEHQVRLYAEFDNNWKSLSKTNVGETVPIRWIPGAKWSMGRKA